MICSVDENIIFCRFFSDEDLFKELKNVCLNHNIKTAIILSGIGQLKNFEIGYFKKDKTYTNSFYSKIYELLNLSGNIIKNNDEYIIHIHAILGDKDKKTIGGHLNKALVEVTCELVLLKININAYRKIEEKTGLKSLF